MGAFGASVFQRKKGRAALACLLCLMMAACVSGFRRPDATEYPRTVSVAIPQTEETAIGTALADSVRAHPGKSGFMLLPNGEESLRARMALVLAAQKSLDLQYYIMHEDSASNLVLEALLRAAERGVRVRFLIDSISFNEVDKSLAILDSNPNIEIRVFNPAMTRRQGLAGVVGAVFRLDKAVKRMHNKALIADNQIAVTGGRNIGDEYFDADAKSNFKDMDLVNAGPIVARISNSFDSYWNSDESFPLRTLRAPSRDAAAVKKLRAEMKQAWEEEFARKEEGILTRDLAREIKAGDLPLVWAPGDFSADNPGKIDTDAHLASSPPLAKLQALADRAEHSFDIVSAYFVPGEDGTAWLASLRARGIRVRVLTNSLASTDVVAVHTGYRRYREDLVRAGVEMYEFKPTEGQRPHQRLFGSSAPPEASLHTKMYILDGKDLVVGSYNLDPRSNDLNTEVISVIHSTELAGQATEIFEQTIHPQQSFRLVLTDKGLVWATQDDKGNPVQLGADPGASFLRKAQTNLFALLPIEGQL